LRRIVDCQVTGSHQFRLECCHVPPSNTMNNVYVPTQVVVLLKRLVNAFSAFGISSQYLHRQARLDEQRTHGLDVIAGIGNPRGVPQQSFDRSKAVEWPSWLYSWWCARNVIASKWTIMSKDGVGLLKGLRSNLDRVTV